jgi:hypothetical protein
MRLIPDTCYCGDVGQRGGANEPRPSGKEWSSSGVVEDAQIGGDHTRGRCCVRVGRDPDGASGTGPLMGSRIRMDDNSGAFALCLHT